MAAACNGGLSSSDGETAYLVPLAVSYGISSASSCQPHLSTVCCLSSRISHRYCPFLHPLFMLLVGQQAGMQMYAYYDWLVQCVACMCTNNYIALFRLNNTERKPRMEWLHLRIVCVCVYVCVVCVCVCSYIRTYAYMCMCVRLCVYVCVCV